MTLATGRGGRHGTGTLGGDRRRRDGFPRSVQMVPFVAGRSRVGCVAWGTRCCFRGRVRSSSGWRTLDEHPAGQAVLEEASTALGRSIAEGCRDEDALATTAFVQPALLACDVAAFRVLPAEGLTDVVGVAGHSLGEFAALVAAELLRCPTRSSWSDRGAAMQRAGARSARAR